MFERLREAWGGVISPEIFFRDDDADRDLQELQTLLGIFRERRVPLSLAVIPGSLQKSGVNLLCEAAKAQVLELHQHGWIHANHETEGRKCEFGSSRSYAEQFADISRGAKVLREAFGPLFTPIFTPPWNRCTAETRRVLRDLDFRALSTIRSDKSVGSEPGLAEVPVSVDIFHWKGGIRLKTEEELTVELLERSKTLPIGVLLHHKTMSKEAWVRLERLLDTLIQCQARFRVMEELCPVAS